MNNETNINNAWMLSFIDLLSIILVFFVMLYSLSSVNENYKKQKISTNFKNIDIVNKSITLNYLNNLVKLNLNYIDQKQINIEDNHINIKLYIDAYDNTEILATEIRKIYNSISFDNHTISILYNYSNQVRHVLNKIDEISNIINKQNFSKINICAKKISSIIFSREYILISVAINS